VIAAEPDSWQAVEGVSAALARGRARPGASLYPALRWAGAGVFVAALVGLVVTIAVQSRSAFAHSGFAFIWSGTWDPAKNQLGAGILIVGTVVTTLAAMVIVVPVGVALAVYLSEMAPRWIATPVSTAVDLLAAIPSIVVGLWALLVLTPVFRRNVEPFLHNLPVLGHLFGGFAYGPSILLASVVLAVMALPAVVTLSRTATAGVPLADREAAMALGATRWQVIRRAVLPGARTGIYAALTLAVGRALGESIAVAMVIGNRPAIPHSLLAPGATLGSAIVNQFAEATPGLGTSSIIALGAVLVVLTVIVNLGGQALLRRKPGPGAAALPPPGPVVIHPTEGKETQDDTSWQAEGFVQARSSRTLPRRRLSGRLMEALCALAVFAGAGPLLALIGFTIVKGFSQISLAFLTHAPTPPGIPGGGISTAITGTAKIAGLALLMAIPVGMLTALFLFERQGRLASSIRFCAGVLTGVPSIILGIFAYGLIVRPTHHFSNLAASFALAVLMLPIMIRANEEALRTIPLDVWEAGIALGSRRSRVARSIVLRGALPGLVSGNLLALARGVGETAPLLFTVAAPTFAITLLIYTNGTQAISSAQQTAWGAALVLLTAVLILSVISRAAASALTRNAR
jgi:phosphate ABC transporter permease protein PstC/phosphate ABC transporter permease subunit PstA